MSKERPWWQTCQPMEFRARVDDMNLVETRTLLAEIKGSLSVLQGQLDAHEEDDRGDPWGDPWRKSALAARWYLKEKLEILKAQIHVSEDVSAAKNAARNDGKNQYRLESLRAAKAHLEGGDHQEALAEIIRFMETYISNA